MFFKEFVSAFTISFTFSKIMNALVLVNIYKQQAFKIFINTNEQE